MKTTVCFWAFFFFLSAFGHLQAQDTSGIINELNRNDASKGKVFVYQDESIKDLVGKPVGSLRSDAATTRMFGYKIQAFSGNNQRTSKDEAYSKQAQINTAFPGLETKIIFESPFWRLRVGNFKSREDAEAMMSQMRQKLPSFGREMYIVRDEVRIAVDE